MIENEDTNDILLKLAKELAINHYNVSLLEQKEKVFRQIFNENIDYHDKSRTVFIIGAGASHNAHEIFRVTTAIIYDLYFKQLKLDTVFEKNNPIWSKFIEEASKISNHSYSDFKKSKTAEELLEKISKNLNFEQNLLLLSNFIVSEDLVEKLKKSIVDVQAADIPELKITEYVPSLLYEIVAHLFKHRYIDVIINMNFDEMLDNSITDEMGDSTYYKIVQDADVRRLKEMVDQNRLRIPIYIKPHGTFRSTSSMKYTVDRYLSHPVGLNLLLQDIFNGTVQDPGKRSVDYLNIVLVGYSFSDIDIQKIIFEQLAARCRQGEEMLAKMRFYIFARDREKNIETFISNFLKWIQNEFTPTSEIANYLKSDLHQTTEFYKNCLDKIKAQIYFVECSRNENKLVDETDDITSLGYIFNKVCDHIREQFKKEEPYVPKRLYRHDLLSKMFNRNFINEGFKENGELIKNPEIFYQKLSRFHCLFAFVKFKGKIPINEIINNRPGKYNMLYFNEVRNQKLDNRKDKNYGLDLISYLEKVFSELPNKIRVSNSLVYSEDFYNAASEDEIKEIIKLVLHAIKDINSSLSDAQADSISEILFKITGTSIREINAIYNDPKHCRFTPFPQSSIINTNLELTWKFFNLVVNKANEWKTLCMIDDTGSPLFNLHNYSDKDDCYLKKLKDHKIFLQRTTKIHKVYDKKAGKLSVVTEVIRKELAGNFFTHVIDDEKSNHRMALFLNERNEPVFGIYFFKPNTKARINPVIFTKEYPRNLDIMLKMFNRSIPKKWSEFFSAQSA